MRLSGMVSLREFIRSVTVKVAGAIIVRLPRAFCNSLMKKVPLRRPGKMK